MPPSVPGVYATLCHNSLATIDAAMKADRLLSELGWKLKHEPTAPRGALVLLARAGMEAPPPLWAPYLPAI